MRQYVESSDEDSAVISLAAIFPRCHNEQRLFDSVNFIEIAMLSRISRNGHDDDAADMRQTAQTVDKNKPEH